MARIPRKAAFPGETGLTEGTENALVQLHQEGAAHAQIVRQTLGDVAPYARTEAITRLRGLMAAGAQVMYEIGKTLLQIRENEPAAEFAKVVAEAGIDTRTAQRFMQAAWKFNLALDPAQADTFGNLSRGKIYELLVLDDQEVKELADGGTVAGLTLDDIELMGTSELRRTLRAERAKAQSQIAVKEKQLDAKNRQLDKLEEQIETLRFGDKDQQVKLAHAREQAVVKAFQDAALEMLGAVQKFDQAVADALTDPTEARTTLTEQTVTWVFQRIAEIALTRGMAVDFQAVVDPLHLEKAA